MKTFTKFFKPLLFLSLFAFSIQAIAVWVPPSTAPTGNNTPSPINVGSLLQEKIGAIYAGGLATPVFQMTTAPVANYVLKSDASGFGSWVDVNTLIGGGGGGGNGMTNPMTTLGDMIYGETAGLPTRLPIGTAGQILKAVNNRPDWEPAPSVETNGWTDDGAIVRLTTATDKVGIGTDIEDVLTEQVTLTGNIKFPVTSQFYTNGSGFGVLFKPNAERLSGRFMHNRGGTYVGERSGNLNLNAVGSGNTGVGSYTIIWGSNGVNNTGLGHHLLINNNLESNNTAVGSNHVGSDNFDNTSIGQNSLKYFYNNPCCNTIQQNNVAFGEGSLYFIPGLSGPVTRNNNTGVGHKALDNLFDGSSNTALGYNADVGSGTLTNATAIGANTVVSASNTMVFGTSSIAGWGFGTQPAGDAIKVGNPGSSGSGARLTQGGAWTDGSDRILKYDIENTKYGLDTILSLRPVDYKLKIDNTDGVGFIAQEVKEVIPELVFGKDGEMTMSYGQLTAVLTKAVQELKEENDMLRARILELKARLEK